MEKAISAANANRNFSELLRGVREGKSYVVTSHGRPIARIVPIENNKEVSAKAHSALLARLRSERVIKVGKWHRDELYEDAE